MLLGCWDFNFLHIFAICWVLPIKPLKVIHFQPGFADFATEFLGECQECDQKYRTWESQRVLVEQQNEATAKQLNLSAVAPILFP